MKTDAAGYNFLEQWEQFKPFTYNVGGVPHIGFGFNKNVWDLPDSMTIEEAREFMRFIVKNEYEPIVNAALTRAVSQNEYNALVSFVYNTGTASDQLFNKVNNKENLSDFWPTWYTSGDGVIYPGLEARRQAEYNLYSSSNGGFMSWDGTSSKNLVPFLLGVGVLGSLVYSRKSR